jgi:hypothetical protein
MDKRIKELESSDCQGFKLGLENCPNFANVNKINMKPFIPSCASKIGKNREDSCIIQSLDKLNIKLEDDLETLPKDKLCCYGFYITDCLIGMASILPILLQNAKKPPFLRAILQRREQA